jgi:hypothetical protein
MRHFLSFLLVTTACAADNVRVELSARGSAALTAISTVAGGGRAATIGWGPEEKRAGSLCAHFSIPARTWTEVGFTFTPSADDEAVLRLLGPWKAKPGTDNKVLEEILVTYDAVRVEGSAIQNATSGMPKAWTTRGTGQQIVTTGAQSGTNAVSAWHNGSYAQVIKVKAGTPVTVRLWAWSEIDPAAK